MWSMFTLSSRLHLMALPGTRGKEGGTDWIAVREDDCPICFAHPEIGRPLDLLGGRRLMLSPGHLAKVAYVLT